jgi:hypothetical protein
MKYFLALLLLLLSTVAYTDDLSQIAGKYNYEQYQLVLGSGKVLSMTDIGAKSITVEFNKDSTLFMKMNMLDGKVIEATALIKEININGNKGYWIAQWPDMDYTVRKDFSFHDDIFEYEIKFENKQDPMRYGTVEHAVLRKTNAF